MMAPQFYSGKWNHPYCIYKQYTAEKFMESLKENTEDMQRYILFFQEDDIYKRVAAFKIKTGLQLEYRYTAEPSWFDKLLHWLNPRNKNNPIYIFRIRQQNQLGESLKINEVVRVLRPIPNNSRSVAVVSLKINRYLPQCHHLAFGL